MNFFSNLDRWPAQTGIGNPSLTAAGTAIATVAMLSLVRRLLWPTPPKTLHSPLRTVVSGLSQDEIAKLDYKPDIFPGARDVETPYGSIRVYEWGPLSGDKVLFVHGISTSCMTLGKLAHALVEERGCRVMLFDLFGRGFSDNPADLPHDARLYTTQILLALASATETSWTAPREGGGGGGGSGGFKLVGYSLGGGIAVHFAAAFPHLVSSLVLLAPAGLIRPQSFGAVTRLVFSTGLVPPPLLEWITRRRLRQPIGANSKRWKKKMNSNINGHSNPTTTTGDKPDPVSASLTEIPSTSTPTPTPNLPDRVLRAIHWQLRHHRGFVPAFLSTIRHAPLTDQHAAWARLAGTRAPGTTCVILGADDEIIDPDEYAADALPLLGGTAHVRWSVLSGPGSAHDFPMTLPRETLGEMYKAWGWESE
ncbi:hypothetical protein VTK26DRAFT_8518 [Humicola hyalothermophila]